MKKSHQETIDAREVIDKLDLQPHPEGGYFRETYRSGQRMNDNEGQSRNVSTAIYYLLENGDKSHFHRISSDEVWFFHTGRTLEIIVIDEGQLSSILLGNNMDKGEVPQAVIPAGKWFAAHIKDATGYALASCTVAPGFEFSDFELADRERLSARYPRLKEVIHSFTRG